MQNAQYAYFIAILQTDAQFIESRNMSQKLCLISVDIETTGPTPMHYSMYELGACAVETHETFERKLALLPHAKFSCAALRAVRTTKRELLRREDVVSPRKAMRDFAVWTKTVAKGSRPVFVATNAPFDWMFIAWYFEECKIKNPFGHNALDMKAYYMGMFNASWDQSTLNNMTKHCGLLPVTLPHQALRDAEVQKEIFIELLKMNSNTQSYQTQQRS